MIHRLSEKIRAMVSRGRVIASALTPKRTLVQLSGLVDEVDTEIELFFPYGMSALPTGGEDLVLLQVGGSRAHLVALFADSAALRIGDLAGGEFGFRDGNGQQVVFRGDRLEVTTPLKLVATVTGDADVTVGGNMTGQVSGDTSVTIDGSLTATIAGDATIQAGGDLTASVGGDMSLSVDGKLTVTTPNFHVAGNISASGSIHDHSAT